MGVCKESPAIGPAFILGVGIADPCLQQETVHRWERQMSIEFDRSYVEEVLMLSGLALFLILAAVMPA